MPRLKKQGPDAFLSKCCAKTQPPTAGRLGHRDKNSDERNVVLYAGSSLRHRLTKPHRIRPSRRRPHFVWCGAQAQLQIVARSRVQPSHGHRPTCASVPVGRVWRFAVYCERDSNTHTCRLIRHPKVVCVPCWHVLMKSGKLGNEGRTTPATTPKPRQRRHQGLDSEYNCMP